MPANFTNARARHIAAIFCLLYILIQVYQQYVINTSPSPTGFDELLLQQTTTKVKWQNILLLLSFFPMIFIFLVVSMYDFKRNPLMYSAAFTGFFIFCLIEILIRSVEHFYINLVLPAGIRNIENYDGRALSLNRYSAFQDIRYANQQGPPEDGP